jgi:NAD+ kinase
MKVAVVSPRNEAKVRSLLKEAGLKTSARPDVVVSYGGDGTLLVAEQRFPGVPKLIVRDSEVCHRCEYEGSSLAELLDRLKKKDFEKSYAIKLKCGEMVALNEFQLHNADPTTAIRFAAETGDDKLTNIIADGAIVCTPFGSSGYYLSAGGKPFDHGIGFVLNNPHNAERRPRVLPDNSSVTLTLQRGPGLLCHDNAGCVELIEGKPITITKAKERTCFLRFP